METKYYESERDKREVLIDTIKQDVIRSENLIKDKIKTFIDVWGMFKVNEVFKIQWPNEDIPVETYRIKNIRWGITYDSDSKSDIIYDCIRIVKRNGRPSNRTTAISQTSIINSKHYEKHLDILQ